MTRDEAAELSRKHCQGQRLTWTPDDRVIDAVLEAYKQGVEAPAGLGLPTAGLRTECLMLGTPKPVGFGVFLNGKHVAVLEYSAAAKAVEEFERMVAERYQKGA